MKLELQLIISGWLGLAFAVLGGAGALVTHGAVWAFMLLAASLPLLLAWFCWSYVNMVLANRINKVNRSPERKPIPSDVGSALDTESEIG